MEYISKSGYTNGKQNWQLYIGKKIKNSIDKQYLEWLLNEYKKGYMSIDDIKRHRRARYVLNKAYIGKSGKLKDGTQTWCIRINKKNIRRNKDKDFLKMLINKYNNGEIDLQQLKEYRICQYCGNVFYSKNSHQKYCNDECKKEDYKKYYRKNQIEKKKKEKKYQQYSVLQLLKPRAKVGLGGMSNKKQAYRLTWNSNLIRRSIDKEFLNSLADKLNSYQITIEEAKNITHKMNIKNNFIFNDEAPILNIGVLTLDDIYLTSGVYYILNLINKKIYIGASRRLGQRINSEHLKLLNNNIHQNPYLQNAWNKYGSGNFSFGILELCNNIFDSEKFWINFFQSNISDYGYNLTSGGDNPPIHYGVDNNRYREDVWGDMNQICFLYKKGYSIKKICEIYNTSHTLIVPLLAKNNIIQRDENVQRKINIILKNNLFNIEDFTNIDVDNVPRIILGSFNKKYQKQNYALKVKNIMISSFCKDFLEDCAIKYYNKEYTLEDLTHIQKICVTEYYKLWEMHKVAYKKYKHNCLKNPTDPCHSFFVKYFGKIVFNNGFLDFYTPMLIHDLIREYSR